MDYNHYHTSDPWHMHQDLKIEHWKGGYVYTYIWVAHLRFRICELLHFSKVEQVVFRLDVALVLVSAA